MGREEAVEILSDMRAEYNLFGDEEEATRYHVLSMAIGAVRFAEWVAEEVMREDFGDGFFVEVACRKLYRLGIITMDGDKWKLEEVTE